MLINDVQSIIKMPNAPLQTKDRLTSIGCELRDKDTTFSGLYCHSDNNSFERLDIPRFAHHINKRIKVIQGPDEPEECPGAVDLSANSLK